MKVLLKSVFASAAALASMAQAKDMGDYEPNGYEVVVNCGTGDAISGLDVIWGASKKLYISIQSEDDQQPPTIYYTEPGVDSTKVLAAIRAGQDKVVKFRTDESTDFGGETYKAALLQIQVNNAGKQKKKKLSQERSSQVAEGGGVISLFCNLKKSE